MKMRDIIKDPVLVSAIQDLAWGLKSEADLSSLTRELTIEASLNAEMEAQLSYPKHSPTGHHSGNSRNGYGSKSLKGDHGVLEIETPRDRNGTFEPQFVV
jgi:transposase-like protein